MFNVYLYIRADELMLCCVVCRAVLSRGQIRLSISKLMDLDMPNARPERYRFYPITVAESTRKTGIIRIEVNSIRPITSVNIIFSDINVYPFDFTHR